MGFGEVIELVAFWK